LVLLSRALEEPRPDQAEGERRSDEDCRLPTGETLDVRQQVIDVFLAQLARPVLDLIGRTLNVTGDRVVILLAKLLSARPYRLCDAAERVSAAVLLGRELGGRTVFHATHDVACPRLFLLFL